MSTEARVDQLAAADQQSRAFEVEHGWRRERIVEINNELAHHWAAVTLGAVREDDPLAFGIDELRRARATYARDLNAVLRTVPRDRSGALRQAEVDAQRATEMLRFADRQVARRNQEWDDAHQRRRGRRNKIAIAEARGSLSAAETDLATARENFTRTREVLASERAADAARHRALEATKDERTELRRTLREIDAALEDTRVERVLALAHDDSPPFYLLESLGEVPLSRGGQQAWCGLAIEIERYRDRHAVTNEFMALGADPECEVQRLPDKNWNRVNDLIRDADAIIEVAHELDPVERNIIDIANSSTWTMYVTEAQQRVEAMREVDVPEIVMEAEPDLGLSW